MGTATGLSGASAGLDFWVLDRKEGLEWWGRDRCQKGVEAELEPKPNSLFKPNISSWPQRYLWGPSAGWAVGRLPAGTQVLSSS